MNNDVLIEELAAAIFDSSDVRYMNEEASEDAPEEEQWVSIKWPQAHEYDKVQYRISAVAVIKTLEKHFNIISDILYEYNHCKKVGIEIPTILEQKLSKLASDRHSYTLKSLPDNLYTAIVEAKVDPKYNDLNKLLDGEKDD